MVQQRMPWGTLLSELGRAILQLLLSEVADTRQELTASARQLAGVALFGVFALLCALLGLGALIAAAIAGLALVMPLWAAALVVGVAILAISGLLALSAKRRFQSIQSPVETVRLRLNSHVEFWRDEVLAEGGPPVGASRPDEDLL